MERKIKLKEVSEKYLKKIYLNILKAIIILLYFFILNLAYENISSEYLEKGIKIFTMIFLFIAIYIFEKAYKKDDDDLALQGIEILVLSAYTLTTEHITNKLNFEFKNYSLVASYMFAIYFILKGIIIYTKGRKEVAQNLSDIREIVKKDEPIKKEATKKKKKEEKIEEIKEKLDNKQEKDNDTNMKKKSKTNKTTKNNNKRSDKTKTDTRNKNTKNEKEEVKIK